jgi:cation diffusion facilitator CzcD-associated flavoprotein CzcO
MSDRSDRICIVGAGPGGLAAAAAMQSRGVPFDIIDAGQELGGIWDIDRPGTPMYDSAHFISSKTLSGLPGFPMPDHYPDYPGHTEVLAYVRAYAREHDLERHVTSGRRVVAAKPEPDEGWSIELDSGETRIYAGLCAATGSNWHPLTAEVAGDFDGEAYHSQRYRSREEFRGKRVLIVGGGNSGCDIACDAAQSADRAFISLRRGYHFIPKYVLGKPSDVFAHTGPTLPAWLEQRVFSFLIGRLLVGDLTKYGLPKPDHPILESHPIMNTEILEHLEKGRLEVRPDIEELRGDSVAFTDGTEERIDLILWATGYERRYPFLDAADLDIRDGAIDLFLNSVSSAPPRSVLHRPVRDGRRGIPTIRPSSRPHSTLPRCAPGRGLGRRVRPTAGHGVSRPEGWAALCTPTT